MTSSIPSFEIINVTIPCPNTFIYSCICCWCCYKFYGIKTFLVYVSSTFFIKGQTVFSNWSRSLSRSPPHCNILTAVEFFDNFILANLCGKLVYFNLSSSKLHNTTFKLIYWVILYWYYIKTKKIYNTLTVPCEKRRLFLLLQ